MKRFGCCLAGALLASAVTVPAAKADLERYEIDPAHFSIGFLVGHLGYERVLGMFLEGEGEFMLDDQAEQVSEIHIEIEAESVFTNNRDRDRHLRSGDFLNAGEFPTIVFEGTEVEKTGINSAIIRGDLTLLGQTRPVSVDVTVNKIAVYPFDHERKTVGVSARATFNRGDFGMTYGLDNGMVADEVELIFEFEGVLD
jgi:polyisoprenoid-binding protein YceI